VPQLLHRIQRKELDVKGLAKYPPDLLWPDGPYGRAMLKLRTKDMAMEAAKAKEEDYSGLFKCGKCKSVKTTYYQMQTRSADEPMVRSLIVIVLVIRTAY
jgi:transcription elongation factor S-II